MGRDHCIEAATFKLKAGVTDDELLALETRIRSGRIAEFPGYMGRELGNGHGTGDWLMLLRFETRAQLDVWMREVKSVPEMRERAVLFEPGSLSMRFFTHAEPLAQK